MNILGRDREYEILLTVPNVTAKRELYGNERPNVIQEACDLHVVATTLTPQEFYKHVQSKSIDFFLESHNIHGNENHQIILLVCGDLNILLSKNDCVVIKDSFNRYFFVLPDNEVINLTLPDLDEDLILKFEQILNNEAKFRVRDGQYQRQDSADHLRIELEEEPVVLASGTSRGDNWADFITTSIEKSGDVISKSITFGSSWLADKTLENGEYLRQQVSPGVEPVRVNETIQDSVRKAREYTAYGNEVFSKTVKEIASATSSLGSTLSSQLPAFPQTQYSSEIETAKKIAYSSLASANQVLQGKVYIHNSRLKMLAINESVNKLMSSTSFSATSLIEHRFGPEVGEISRDTFGVFEQLAGRRYLAPVVEMSSATSIGPTQQEEIFVDLERREQILLDID
jgi:hypothetical protein